MHCNLSTGGAISCGILATPASGAIGCSIGTTGCSMAVTPAVQEVVWVREELVNGYIGRGFVSLTRLRRGRKLGGTENFEKRL